MKLQDAQLVAEALYEHLQPLCQRLEVAGSIRRGAAEVGDIELVAVPKRGEVQWPDSLLPEEDSLLHHWALTEAHAHGIHWIKTGTMQVEFRAPARDAKFLRAQLPCTDLDPKTHEIRGGTLDLFIANPTNWGYTLAIRTGDAEFSRALVTYAGRIGYQCRDGYLWDPEGNRCDTPDEEELFRLLRLEYVPPPQRQGWNGIRARRVAA